MLAIVIDQHATEGRALVFPFHRLRLHRRPRIAASPSTIATPQRQRFMRLQKGTEGLSRIRPPASHSALAA